MFVKKFVRSLLMIIALSALAACGEAQKDTTTGGTTGAALTVDTASGVENKFVPPTINASAGEVNVTFNNKGAVPHNWTLVKQGEEDKAAAEAQTAAPDYKYAGALAQTKTLVGGANQDLTVKLDPGTYAYLCTFPGHYQLGMKGTLTVK